MIFPLVTPKPKSFQVSVCSFGVESNQKQMDVNQKCYKNEPCFEYMNSLRDKTGKDDEVNSMLVTSYFFVIFLHSFSSLSIISFFNLINSDSVIGSIKPK